MELICTDANGLRPVNDLEIEALEFTFGEEVGNWLIDIIRIRYDPSLIKEGFSGLVPYEVNGKINLTQINMASDYIPGNLWWFGSFIHEATHIWQLNTCRHLKGVYAPSRNDKYNVDNFACVLEVERHPDLVLKVEQHAKALEHWFFATYGREYNLLDEEYQITSAWVWGKILEYSENSAAGKTSGETNLARLQDVNRVWQPLIEEIQDPTHIPDIPGKICEELKERPGG